MARVATENVAKSEVSPFSHRHPGTYGGGEVGLRLRDAAAWSARPAFYARRVGAAALKDARAGTPLPLAEGPPRAPQPAGVPRSRVF